MITAASPPQYISLLSLVPFIFGHVRPLKEVGYFCLSPRGTTQTFLRCSCLIARLVRCRYLGGWYVGVPGPPDLGVPLPRKPEMEGNLEITWPVSLVLQPCHWGPGRGLAAQRRTIGFFVLHLNCMHQAGLDSGQWKPPGTWSDQEPVPGHEMSGGASRSCVYLGRTF